MSTADMVKERFVGADSNAESLVDLSPQPRRFESGFLYTIRSTGLADVLRFESVRPGTTSYVGMFSSHQLRITVDGGAWEFRGAKGCTVMRQGAAVAGQCDERYSAIHYEPHCDYILRLHPDALDPDVGVIFEKQVLVLPSLIPIVERVMCSESDDAFESRVFETFDWVSRRSMGRSARLERSSLRMQRIKRFIERHALEEINLADIAAAAGLNPFVCVRQYKTATGMTPYAYLIACRAEEARRLLRASRFAVEEIASRTGFKDHGHFCRFFKRSTGTTPTEYRRRSAS